MAKGYRPSKDKSIERTQATQNQNVAAGDETIIDLAISIVEGYLDQIGFGKDNPLQRGILIQGTKKPRSIRADVPSRIDV